MSSRAQSTPGLVLSPSPGFLYTCRLAPDGTYTFDAPAAEVEALYEITPAEMGQMLTAGRLPILPNESPELWASIRASAEALTPWVGDTHIRSVRTNRERWVRLHSVPHREADGTVVWQGLITDITDLKLAEQELRSVLERLAHSEARMRAALDGAKMFGWDLDLESNRWYTTIDVSDFYGLPRGPDYSDPTLALAAVLPEDVPGVLANRQRAIETGEPMRYEFRGRVPAPDGLPRWFSTRGQVIRNADGKAVRLVAVTTDITERKRAEAAQEALNQQLLETQKWESLGVLAGGIAHDFNNLLTVVLGSAGLARKGMVASHSAVAHLDQIEQACRRAADLCRQLLAYSGRGQLTLGTTDLNQLVRGSAALLKIPASPQVAVRFLLAENLPLVHGDPAQLRQVLISLVMNAAEAIGDALGEIRVTTSLVDVDGEPPVGYHLPPAPGRYVRLAVSDTGPGLTPETRARMFDPFFTTKFAGRGLGLAAVLGIARSHGGAIRVASAPGKGTTVETLWPVGSSGARATEPSSALTSSPRSTGAGFALIADDEIFVREVTASTLEELGYQPLLAGDAETALELFSRHREEIRVAVLDIVMPGMTGDLLLERLRAVSPTLPVVLVSGFTDRRVAKPGVEFLQKPFHPEELIAVVKRAVQAAGRT